MIAGQIIEAEFTLYGSFSRTYRGHGTDRALLGGIMGFKTDDRRIRDSFSIAQQRGLRYSFLTNEKDKDVHPNTVDIRMVNDRNQEMTVRGESLGGGKVRIVKINQVDVDFTGEYSSLIVIHQDKPGGGGPYFQVPQRLQCEHRLHEAFQGGKRSTGLLYRGVR